MHLDDKFMLLTAYVEMFHWHTLLNWLLCDCNNYRKALFKGYTAH